jgi:hypothetical protein
MKKRDLVIGVIILAVLALVIYFWQAKKPKLSVPEEPSPTSTEESFETKFNITIPEDVEKTNLIDITGGNSEGLATRKYDNGTFMHSVLADLPDPDGNNFYEGWLVRGKPGENDFDFISTGKMKVAKGGWVLNFDSSTDYTDYEGVVITLETVFDDTPEEHILEGSF